LEVYAEHRLPPFGAETHQMKVLAERYEGRSLKLLLSAPTGTIQSLGIRVNVPDLHPRLENAHIGAISEGLGRFTVAFPAANVEPVSAASYVNQTVTISW
jgi:hypothetical protein